MRRSHADLMGFDGSEDDGYSALREWIALVLDPVAVGGSSGDCPLPPEYLDDLTHGKHYPLSV